MKEVIHLESKEILAKIIEICKETIHEQLVGIYLHGSLAMHCFNEDKSDIDFIIVVKQISEKQKLFLLKQMLTLDKQITGKGLEFSVVNEEVCQHFIYPTPFLTHYSRMHTKWLENHPHDYVKQMKGVDEDLAAHFTIIKQRGISLYGKAILEVFGEIEDKYYLDSILLDINNATEDILENPIYIILNVCRVYAFIKNHVYLSKLEGGQWGIKYLNEAYHPIIQEALSCYCSRNDMQIEKKEFVEFARDLLIKIREK